MKPLRYRAALPVGLATAIAGVYLVHGCAGDDSAQSPPGADAGDASDATQEADGKPDTRDVQTSEEAADTDAGCSPRLVPSDVPDGWEEFTDWACDCRYYVAVEGAMPEPIQWEDCPEPAPQQIGCRYMTPFWAQRTGWVISTFIAFKNHPTYGPMLAFTRTNFLPEVAAPAGMMTLVAQVDGKVFNGLYQRHGVNDGCYQVVESLTENAVLMSLYGGHSEIPNDFEMMGAMGFEIGAPRPRVVRKHVNTVKSYGINGSSRWLVEWEGGGLRVMDWDASAPTQIYPTQDPFSNLPSMQTYYVDDDVFFRVSGGGNAGIVSWDPDAGTRPLLHWYDDPSRGAGDFGSDGVDMVWVQGDSKPAGGWYHEYQNKQIRTAPFTTDPVQAQSTSRRLRDLPENQSVCDPDQAFVVGCGLAAHVSRDPCRITVIRISDGYAWYVPCAEDLQQWGYVRALGITCDEVFAMTDNGTAKYTPTIARIRLDTLGDPVPPD